MNATACECSQDSHALSVFGSLLTIDISESSFSILIVVAAVVLVNRGFYNLHLISYDTQFEDLFVAIEHELMIVGSTSFLFKIIVNATTFISSSWEAALEYADVLIPIVSISFCLQGLLLIIASLIETKIWARGCNVLLEELLDEFYAVMNNPRWQPLSKYLVLEKMKFRMYRLIFCEEHMIVRNSLAFDEYVQRIHEMFLRDIITIRTVDWCLVCLVIFVNWFISITSLKYSSGCSQADESLVCEKESYILTFAVLGFLLFVVTSIFAAVSFIYKRSILTSRGIVKIADYPVYLKYGEEPNLEAANSNRRLRAYSALNTNQSTKTVNSGGDEKRPLAVSNTWKMALATMKFSSLQLSSTKVIPSIVGDSYAGESMSRARWKKAYRSIQISRLARTPTVTPMEASPKLPPVITPTLTLSSSPAKRRMSCDAVIGARTSNASNESHINNEIEILDFSSKSRNAFNEGKSNAMDHETNSNITLRTSYGSGSIRERHKPHQLRVDHQATSGEEGVHVVNVGSHDSHCVDTTARLGMVKLPPLSKPGRPPKVEGLRLHSLDIISRTTPRSARAKLFGQSPPDRDDYVSPYEKNRTGRKSVVNENPLGITDIERLRMSEFRLPTEDILSIFWMSYPALYFAGVKWLIISLAMYLGLWFTNYLPLSIGVDPVFWVFLTMTPGFCSICLYVYIVKCASILKAMTSCDPEVMADVLEQTKNSHILATNMRDTIIDRLKGMGDDDPVNELKHLFAELDVNHTNRLGLKPFKVLLKDIGVVQFSRKNWEQMFKLIDRDSDGQVTLDDLFIFLFPDHHIAKIEENMRIRILQNRIARHASMYHDHRTRVSEDSQIAKENIDNGNPERIGEDSNVKREQNTETIHSAALDLGSDTIEVKKSSVRKTLVAHIRKSLRAVVRIDSSSIEIKAASSGKSMPASSEKSNSPNRKQLHSAVSIVNLNKVRRASHSGYRGDKKNRHL